MNIGPKFKFIRGIKDNYLPESEHKDAIYFAIDTAEILMNGVCYGSAGGGNIEDVTIAEGNILTVVFSDPEKENYTFDLNTILLYASSMPDDLVVPDKIGGLSAGITAAELKKKSISQILDDIIFPEVNPTVAAPSCSVAFTISSGFTNKGVYEVGSEAPTINSFSAAFNRGTSKVPGMDTLNVAGEIDIDNSFIYYGTSTSNKTLPEKVELGTMTYTYQASYAEGDVLVTSKGNKATADSTGKAITNPRPAGVIKSASVSIYGTYPYFCNGESASNSTQESSLPTAVKETKLPLVAWTTTLIGAKFASEAITERLVFEFPATKKVTKVEFMNTVSGKWEVIDESEYIVTEPNDPKVIQGNEVFYKRLTTKDETPKKGALQLRFTLANA